MKLATLADGSRDGTLAVVSKDLSRAVKADAIAPTLQAALDDWSYCAPLLAELATDLEAGRARHAFDFDPARCMAPLPRAFQLADGSAYLVHVELILRARKQEPPPGLRREPLMYQGCSAPLLGPCDGIALADEALGLDLEAEVAVVTGDVPMGADRETAAASIRLLMLMNDVSLREPAAAEFASGFGFFHSKPPSSFSPVALTPDELGEAWDGRRLHGTLRATVNGNLLGELDTGKDMHFDFPRLIAHAARTRPLCAGTLIGSGTVSNRDRNRGAGCLLERRAEETLAHGEPRTSFLRYGDRVRIEMRDAAGRSIFGAIDQQVVAVR